MIQSRFTAKSGLLALQQRLDTIGNNIANVDTVGFKNSRADFKSLVYSQLERPVQPQDDLNLNRGTGAMVGATTKSFLPGSATTTDYPLDAMIEGDGLFTIQNAGGDKFYTRAGNFALSAEGTNTYLVTQDGYYVTTYGGEKIDTRGVPADNVTIASDGTVYAKIVHSDATPVWEETVQVGKIGLAKFMNRQGLEAVGANKYIETEASGAPQEDANSTVMQGYIEGSNTDLATEMTRLIRTQRAFQLVSRALTTADEMDHQANTIRS